MNNTQDLSEFGLRELDMAGTLLKAFSNNPNVLDEYIISVEFDPESGNVFIMDDDYNVAMMNGDILERFYSCPECGEEGFKDELSEYGNKCCIEYLNEVE